MPAARSSSRKPKNMGRDYPVGAAGATALRKRKVRGEAGREMAENCVTSFSTGRRVRLGAALKAPNAAHGLGKIAPFVAFLCAVARRGGGSPFRVGRRSHRGPPAGGA